METKVIKRLIENGVISAFSLKQPRKVAFDYNGIEYIVNIVRENFANVNVAIECLNVCDVWQTIAQKDVAYYYAPQYVINIITNNK